MITFPAFTMADLEARSAADVSACLAVLHSRFEQEARAGETLQSYAAGWDDRCADMRARAWSRDLCRARGLPVPADE